MLCEVKSATAAASKTRCVPAWPKPCGGRAEAEQRLDVSVNAGILIELEPDALWQIICKRLEIALAWPPHLNRLVALAPAE